MTLISSDLRNLRESARRIRFEAVSPSNATDVQNAIQELLQTQSPVVTPEQFGYNTYGAGNASPAIQAAIDSAAPGVGLTIDFGMHTYLLRDPIIISKPYIWLRGQGYASVLQYAPSANNTAMITWHDPSVTTGLYFGKMTDFLVVSGDFVNVKTAINLIDIGDMEVSGIYIALWTDATFNSIGLQTNGRQTSSFHDLRIFADRPIFLDKNPNQLLSADHFHFWNLYVIPAAIRPCIEIGNILVSNSTFDGFQAWVGGKHGLYYNAPTPGGGAFGVSFYNVRVEEGADATGYSFYVNAPQGVASLLFKNCRADVNRLGLFARGATTLSVEQMNYIPVTPAAKMALDVDATCLSVLVSNCRWESGCIQSLGGLNTVYSYNTPATSPIPSNALYAISQQTAASGPTPTPVNFAMSPYTPAATDQILLVDTSGGAVTIQMPLSATRNLDLEIKDVTGNAAANPISVLRSGGENIDGLTTYPLDSAYAAAKLGTKTGGYYVHS